MPRKKKKKSKIPENYLKGSKNRSAKAAEIRCLHGQWLVLTVI